MLGVMLDRGSLDRGDLGLQKLEDSLSQWKFYDHTAEEELHQRISEAEIIVTNKVPLDEAAFAAATNLKMVAVAATGTNNVDLEAARSRGVVVCNVRHYATPSVVQHVLMLILNLMRSQPAYSADVAAGAWQRSDQFCLLDHPISELQGLTLGIVGYGELGRAVADAAERLFEMKILVAQRPGTSAPEPEEGEPERIPLNELLPQVDILSLHCPLTPETSNLIDAKALALMQPHALLINAARGGIVDEQALVAALQAGRLGGAGFDVLTEEPPRHGNPLLEADLPNLIVTPHIAWASRQSRQRMVDQLVENICAFISGQPQNQVT